MQEKEFGIAATPFENDDECLNFEDSQKFTPTTTMSELGIALMEFENMQIRLERALFGNNSDQ